LSIRQQWGYGRQLEHLGSAFQGERGLQARHDTFFESWGEQLKWTMFGQKPELVTGGV
jgi:hypothetical protein